MTVRAWPWWAGWPRGYKSAGGGGWPEKSPKSWPTVIIVADNKKSRRKKWEKKWGKEERGSRMTNYSNEGCRCLAMKARGSGMWSGS